MSIFEASVQQAFAAHHSLPLPTGGVEDSHKHTWLITATFRGRQLDDTMGVVIDFVRVQAVLAEIAAGFESRNLNDLPAFMDGRSSAERVARAVTEHLIDALGDELTPPTGPGPWLHCVQVTEAPGCSAAFFPHA